MSRDRRLKQIVGGILELAARHAPDNEEKQKAVHLAIAEYAACAKVRAKLQRDLDSAVESARGKLIDALIDACGHAVGGAAIAEIDNAAMEGTFD